MIFGFDLLWLVGLGVAWGPAGAAAGLLLQGAGDAVGWPRAFLALPFAYLVFLLGVVVTVGAVACLVPKPREGSSRVFRDWNFFLFLVHWGLESYLPRPLISHVQLLTSLRTLYYRLMGAKLGWSTHLSPGTRISGPALLRLGHLTYIGDHAHIATHLSQGDKILLAPVVVGDRCNVGAHCHIGPGSSFGSDVRIGALTDIAPGCWVEDEVDIGPSCQLGMGVKIGEGSRIEPRSFLPSWTAVPAGEIWAGDPACKVGEVSRNKARSRRRDRR
ncbi:MAG: hypothetical protein VX498_09100 [Myxococcota bacterium]|nr:hypothetical protein [Myxococcota bacterium]